MTGLLAIIVFLLVPLQADQAREAVPASGQQEVVPAIPADYRFDVYRKGRRIGRHEISFVRLENNDLEVRVALAIKVSFGPIPLFRYKHTNREVWRAGQLVALETMTVENGQTRLVRGKAVEAGFLVTGIRGKQLLPAAIITTNYWNPALVSQRQLLDTQTGDVLNIAVEDRGFDREAGAVKYTISGDMDLDIWYQEGRLIKMKFIIDRTQIDYLPIRAGR